MDNVKWWRRRQTVVAIKSAKTLGMETKFENSEQMQDILIKGLNEFFAGEANTKPG